MKGLLFGAGLVAAAVIVWRLMNRWDDKFDKQG